jgi:hypothetical protein
VRGNASESDGDEYDDARATKGGCGRRASAERRISINGWDKVIGRGVGEQERRRVESRGGGGQHKGG